MLGTAVFMRLWKFASAHRFGVFSRESPHPLTFLGYSAVKVLIR